MAKTTHTFSEGEYYDEVLGMGPIEPSEINDLGGSDEPTPANPF